jgi:Na+/H+ antiporter NhaD/arsenite permease-like protein
MDLTTHWVGIVSILLFVGAYSLVITEEFTHLRKSKPVMLAAGIIWALIAYQYADSSQPHVVEEAVHNYLTEFAQLFLFLLAAMTYVNAMSERNVFLALRSWLTQRSYNYRTMFWITGILSFFLSPVIDNLTTALVMCAVVMAIGQGNPRFIGIACVNIVVAANAGGAFSPFGDITTLMVWQRGIISFGTFFALFLPSVVNFLVPAMIMSLAVPTSKPAATEAEDALVMKRGARRIMILFICTIVTAVSFHNFLHLPPFLGMMTGLAGLFWLLPAQNT